MRFSLTVNWKVLFASAAGLAAVSLARALPVEQLAAAVIAEPTFAAAVSGRQDLAPLMARAVIRPLALVSGELYTAKDAQGELVGFTLWAPPGRSAFDTPEQLEMGFNEFLGHVDEEGRAFQMQVNGEVVPKFLEESLGIENAELDCYLCWFAMVREDYQRKGVCRALFDLTYEKAKATGATLALLTGTESNVAVYEKLGFKERGRQKFESPWAEWTFYCMARDANNE
ncbi:hypothetical protein TRAPUB_11545 [Trametes pubescens]|uniref:N-acetyltransferase domain-containing protein n=1 Tax=Trametes pubescens TaxID=154538 RepID=A0A1M2VWB1_TRAPU|nr:hypothetical protein TRAPUB_11545 [Trametes pubescens]